MNCNYCEWKCKLSNQDGVCGRYIEQDEKIVEKEPFEFVEFYNYTFECMPFYHVKPGEYVLQTGTVSCNARCDYCINSHLAIKEDSIRKLKKKDAGQIVKLAKNMNAQGIVFALNEVTCFMQTACELADTFHREGMVVGCLTNGFQTEECANLLADKMDFINVSLKSLSDEFYKKNLGLSSVQPVLRNIKIFNEKSHVEIVTPLVFEILDKEIYEIMDFIYSVNPEMVWHLFRLMPTHKRAGEEDISQEKMLELLKAAREKLPFTYLGNFAGSRWVDTYCPSCGEMLVKRITTGAWLGNTLKLNVTADGKCPSCGREIPIVL